MNSGKLQERRAYFVAWRKSHPNYHRKYRTSLQGKISAWKGFARRRKLEWKLTEEDISKIPLICAYSGIPLTYDVGQDNTISLDRIDSTKGYVAGNVVFCTSWVNRMKQEKSIVEFVQMCKTIVEHNKNECKR